MAHVPGRHTTFQGSTRGVCQWPQGLQARPAPTFCLSAGDSGFTLTSCLNSVCPRLPQARGSMPYTAARAATCRWKGAAQASNLEQCCPGCLQQLLLTQDR